MTREALRLLLQQWPVVASVQASPGSPLADPEHLLAMALASQQNGVQCFRLEGRDAIKRVRPALKAPVIGLIKREYAGSEVYISPTRTEVEELLSMGCEIIALDATNRARPHSEQLGDLIHFVKASGRLVMADCDNIESVRNALQLGVDIVSTTLAGYTSESTQSSGPDLDFLRQVVRENQNALILAEGRFAEAWQVQSALGIGAHGVVIGGALNDPVKLTRQLAQPFLNRQPVCAVDIGGTWMRFAVFDGRELHGVQRVPLPDHPEERHGWIEKQLRSTGLYHVGVSAGGTIDPKTNTVIETKSIIPGNLTTRYEWNGLRSVAVNDGLATAWGHAMHPEFSGKRVATLALGTGVGFGWVERGQIMMGPSGQYPRWNDLAWKNGQSYEDVLGGAALTENPSPSQQVAAQSALNQLVHQINQILHPDVLVVCGGVAMAPWVRLPDGVQKSPYGSDAGLFGAGWMAFSPPIGWPRG